MGTNILVYPVILSKNGDGYFVTVPDFTINTEGKDIADAIAMARDAIGLNILQLEANNVTVPEPYSQYFQVQDDDILRTKDGNSRLLVSEMKVLIFTIICIY